MDMQDALIRDLITRNEVNAVARAEAEGKVIRLEATVESERRHTLLLRLNLLHTRSAVHTFVQKHLQISGIDAPLRELVDEVTRLETEYERYLQRPSLFTASPSANPNRSKHDIDPDFLVDPETMRPTPR